MQKSASHRLALLISSTFAIGALAYHDPGIQPPHATADESQARGTLVYNVADDTGKAIAARLTLVNEKGDKPLLFPNTQVAPDELAIRQNIVYSLSGTGAITVPVGKYKVYASHGLEWSIDSEAITITAATAAEFNATLRHEVDTTGWISGDFHLHTLTHSGHGDANLKERVITFVGEGLEFAVATDHNHNTDYEPVERELGIDHRLTSVVGNEVSTSIGHFNAFPLDPARPIPPPQSYDANQLFKLIRKEPNRYNVTPVIQLNHPRWADIDYFGRTKLDPLTALAAERAFSDDFDTIEIFNENEGWGYYDADFETRVNVAQSKHSVLRDWFNLLNRGKRYAAVGNSDSHNVQSEIAGWPRNFMPSPTDDAGAIQVSDVAAALRKQQVFTTMGPFARYTLGGAGMGETVAAKDGTLELAIDVQAASWIDCDRVKVVVNGDVIDTLAVPNTRDVKRFSARKNFRFARDSWLALLIEGDDPLDPIVHTQDRAILPLAVLNPVYIDADGDGRWTSPWDQVTATAADVEDASAAVATLHDAPTLRGMLVFALAEQKHGDAEAVVATALADADRPVRLLAARAAETLGNTKLIPAMEAAYHPAKADPYLRICLLRAMHAAKAERVTDRFLAFIDDYDGKVLSKYGEELAPFVPGDFAREWLVCGYFPNPPDKTALTMIDYGPETRAESSGSFAGKGGEPVTWRELPTNKQGYLDLTQIDRRKDAHADAIAYAQSFIFSPRATEARFALGSDDGCRVWLNGEMIHEDTTTHSASPMQKVGKATLRQGWNRVLFKVENGGGGFGLYFRVMAEGVKLSARPE